jgi:hypothetical protein
MSVSNNIRLLTGANFLRAFFAVGIIGLVAFLVRAPWTDGKWRSCNASLDELQVFVREASTNKKLTLYKVCLGDIEGEISLTPESSAVVGGVVVNSLVLGVESVFDDSRVPYGGQITSTITCENRKYLKAHAIDYGGKGTKLVLAVANGRQIFGACGADQIKYVSAVWAGYDEINGRVITIKLFKPVVNISDIESFQSDVLRAFEKTIGYTKENF